MKRNEIQEIKRKEPVALFHRERQAIKKLDNYPLLATKVL